jgi:hypothetical protein
MPLISPGFEHFLALGRISQQISKRNAHFSPALKRQAYEQVGWAHCLFMPHNQSQVYDPNHT